MKNRVKSYFEDQHRSDLDFDVEIDEIKFNSEEFAKCFIKSFNKLSYDLRECNDKKINDFIEDNRIHQKKLLSYISKINSNVELGKSGARSGLLDYFNKNYQELNYFMDLVFEIYEID